MKEFPLISIIIPVKNGEPWLQEMLTAIMKQSLIQQVEIIAIDSGSTDNTINILKKFPVKIITISPESFNHGETRNIGVRESRGDYIVMTVQDAIPAHSTWLQELLNAFADENIAGVCGLQIVSHDLKNNPIAWFRPASEPVIRKYHFNKSSEFDMLSPDEKRNICSWDDVNAMYKREALLNVPFRKVSFAEDMLWALDALKRGYAIVYNPWAQVYHYHLEEKEFIFRRTFTEAYHAYKFFNQIPKASENFWILMARNVRILTRENRIPWAKKWDWFLFNYTFIRARNRSIKLFLKTVSASDKNIDNLHKKICGTAPQAVNPVTFYAQ